MGAIADAIAAYAQPLLDSTDGSLEQVQKAFTLGQLCWNLAVLPQKERDESLADMKSSLRMDDAEFKAFVNSVVSPMIRRHEEMFPQMHQHAAVKPRSGKARFESSRTTPRRSEKYPGTGRNAPCPCNSGRKYKRCCGRL
jgi:uncharacterized protein YecA (UPF0149 family)